MEQVHSVASMASPTCTPHHSTLEASLSLFLCFGLIISYLPQILRIFIKKTSLGFSPYFLFLGATSSASSFLNVVSLQWAVISCCQWLVSWYAIRGRIEKGPVLTPCLPLTCSTVHRCLCRVTARNPSSDAPVASLYGCVSADCGVRRGARSTHAIHGQYVPNSFTLFLIYYPKELRYERAITLTGPSRQLTAEDVADGYESDSTGDLDSLDSHIAENYSSFDGGVAGQEGNSGLSTADESPEASGIVSRFMDEEDDRSSSAFSRLVPTFWPVWKAPRKPSPLAGNGNGEYAGEQLPSNATSQARGAENGVGEGDEEEEEAQEVLLPESVSRQEQLGVPRELRRKRRVKRRTKEWGLALSLAWLVMFHL
jgi:hypothetical protein